MDVFKSPLFYEVLAELELVLEEDEFDVIQKICDKCFSDAIVAALEESLGEVVCIYGYKI